MFEELTLPHLIERLKQTFEQFPDHRLGGNHTRYKLPEAGLGAFSVFFTQSPSFLAHQRAMKLAKGRCNAESLFEVENVPSDNQLRNLLDPISPDYVLPLYRTTFLGLERGGLLESYRSHAHQLLVAIDGTDYHSSTKIFCDQCNHRHLKNGHTNYFHSVLAPVIVQPGNTHVISLEPEFIVPQDGQEKQDCEIQAAKRWLEKYGAFYARRGVTLLGDDLFSRQPFCQAIKDQHLHFILVCKPDSHPTLYQQVESLAAQQTVGSQRVRRWNGRYAEIDTYRYAHHLALSADPAALRVNWCELTVTREETGALLYHNAFITDLGVSETTVEAIVADGRARWKSENENHNVLKTQGYHLEHNFGHGTHYLASLLLSLNLLAFLFHTVLDLVDERYRAIRNKLGRRQTFFQDLETLLRYFQFNNWEEVFSFMCKGLELDTS
jgi:hypothetical protein